MGSRHRRIGQRGVPFAQPPLRATSVTFRTHFVGQTAVSRTFVAGLRVTGSARTAVAKVRGSSCFAGAARVESRKVFILDWLEERSRH